MSDSVGKRLISFRKSLGLSQRAFAASIGTSHATIAFVESDEREPSRALLKKLAEAHRLSSDWILSGDGEMLLTSSKSSSGRHGSLERSDPARPDHGDVTYNGIDYVFVRRMALSVSAGNGLMPVEEGEAEGIAFPAAWFRRHRINGDLAVIVGVRGDSMAPVIPDGALVLIHVAERAIAGAGIYAFNLDGASYVKRIVPQATEADGRPGAVAILSDNPAYPPLVLSGQDLNRITIVGRVRAVIAQV